MNVIELVLLLLVAGILGVVSQRITGIQVGGLIMSIVVGFAGAWPGTRLSIWLDIYDPTHIGIGNTHFRLLSAIIGAVIVTAGVGWVQWHGRRKKAEKKK